MSKSIAEKEPVNTLVVELAALLHDIADAKFHNGDEEVGPEKAHAFLQQLGVDGCNPNTCCEHHPKPFI